MPQIRLRTNEEQSIHFPLFESRDVGPFMDRETFRVHKGLIVSYDALLYNLRHDKTYIVKIIRKKRYGVEKLEDRTYEMFVLASNVNDLSVWVAEEKQNEEVISVDIRRIKGFELEEVDDLLSEEELKKKHRY